MGTHYDPEWIRSFYDEYGDREWVRWDADRIQRIKLEIHCHYLHRYVNGNDCVLEVGSGSGRFTRELAPVCRHVTVVDISPGQLELNRQHAQQFGYVDSIAAFVELDLLRLSEQFGPDSFETVVCYGGTLSYALDRRRDAVEQLIHVTKPGGTILLSVMSLFGSLHQFLPRILEIDPMTNAEIVRTGDITSHHAHVSRHRHHLFRATELRTLLETAGLEVISMAASNALSATWAGALEEAAACPEKWQEVVEMELEATAEPGYLDGGTHIIAVCRKPNRAPRK